MTLPPAASSPSRRSLWVIQVRCEFPVHDVLVVRPDAGTVIIDSQPIERDEQNAGDLHAFLRLASTIILRGRM
jgi:hypothetical protein